MREIEKSIYKKIKARLYLNAVLPAFEDLLQQSESAQSTMAERHFTLTFQTASGLKSSLTFHEDGCHFEKSGAQRSQIIIHFITEDHLIKEFENKGFRLPLPIKGSTRISDIKAFKALSAILENTLRPEKALLEDPAFHRMHVGMQLGIALRATIELATHEKLSRNIMRNTPEGIAHFRIGEAGGYCAWLAWRKGRLTSGKGEPATPADVTVTFGDADTALKAVGNQIDVMAAIGLGDIQVTGLVPLADSLGYIFERIPLYITP